MFSTERKLVKIKKVSPIEEYKGDKRDYGCSARIEWVAPNTVLDFFDPDARTAFYEREDGKPSVGPSGQEGLTLPRTDIELTKRRCVFIETPIAFKKELDGYTIVFHRGATEKSDIKLTDVKLDGFTADPHDGGSVLISFKASMKPSMQDRGLIDFMAFTEIEITLTPPADDQTKLPLDKTAKPSKKRGTDPFAGSDLAKDGSKIEA